MNLEVELRATVSIPDDNPALVEYLKMWKSNEWRTDREKFFKVRQELDEVVNAKLERNEFSINEIQTVSEIESD